MILSDLLSEKEQKLLRELCPPQNFARGESIYRAGDAATDLFIMIEGKIKLVFPTLDGSERILRVLGPGDFFGEALLAGLESYTSDAVALTDAVISPVCLDKFLSLTSQAPNAALALAQMLANRIQELEEQLEVTTAPVNARVGRALAAFAKRFGEHFGDKTRLKLDLTHEELAAFVGSTRVTVTNAMSELRELGLVIGTRGQYEIDLTALENYSQNLEAN